MDEGRVIRDTIHIERDGGELQVEGIMVPFVIADLPQTAKEGSAEDRSRGCGKREKPPHLLQLPEEFHGPCAFQQRPVEESNPAAVHGQRVVSVAVLCRGKHRESRTALRAEPRAQRHPLARGTHAQHRALARSLAAPAEMSPEEDVWLGRDPSPGSALEHTRFTPRRDNPF